MHFLCFRPERSRIGQEYYKGKNFPLSKLPLEQDLPLFAFSAHFSTTEVNDFPRAGIFLIWRGGDWGKSSPHSSLFCCYLGPHNPCSVSFATILHLSPPMHLDLPPSYLSDSQMGLDCLIRESRHQVISSYLGSNCTRAAAKPEICAPLIPLGPLSRSFSLPALDSRKGRGKFSLQGSVIC